MQRALMQSPDAMYALCSIDYVGNSAIAQYASMADLLSAIGDFTTELLFLRDNYMSWTLILGESATLFIGRFDKVIVIAHGATDTLSDWLYDVTIAPRRLRVPDNSTASETWGSLFENPSFGLILPYLRDLGFRPLQSEHTRLFPAQTDCGETYWYRFIPAKQD